MKRLLLIAALACSAFTPALPRDCDKYAYRMPTGLVTEYQGVRGTCYAKVHGQWFRAVTLLSFAK